ncbi:RNA-binding protein [Exilibacterium tricleocarpae]|uniref:Heat shock protein 15 n=1 Tax=Exilibacterium tricleocarpae TaxID=2591008 RepID=A0A545TK57_9GAMM|nr:S4 domain-containing protein [Exilibacterium tricleocarpae]TQV77603.1 RNA-binding protein [Exilibacterium tricleocarpae]
MEKVRIDKWLWAARFYKTRSLAKQAIEGGKVHADGHKVKPSKDIAVDQIITLRQGWDEKTVVVLALSDQRRGAAEAAALYRETEASIAAREARAEQRKAQRGVNPPRERRPTKKERRQIHQFVNKQGHGTADE